MEEVGPAAMEELGPEMRPEAVEELGGGAAVEELGPAASARDAAGGGSGEARKEAREEVGAGNFPPGCDRIEVRVGVDFAPQSYLLQAGRGFAVAARIGRVKEVQLAPKLYYEGDYVRVRARVLVSKALTRFTPLTVKGECNLLSVGYEKIPYFCQVSGFMGHNHEECGDGVWEQKHKQFGSWMPAKRKEAPQVSQGGGRPMRGGRHGARGRDGTGEPASCIPLSEDVDLVGGEEEGETMTSPLKSG
ncbi:hypothetical protein D1007_18668 [Hordeum vulgare]|nr:hypothetical protein D1007_18668 [Hordeum vulgare]